MARRWTPRRFVRLRRIRVAICAVAVALASTVAFGVAARKTIALSINGDTQTVTTYAMSVTRLLEERGVDNPGEGPGIGIDEATALADLQARGAQQLTGGGGLARTKEDAVAGRGAGKRLDPRGRTEACPGLRPSVT